MIQKLDSKTFAEIYNRYTINDFPEDELKPLSVILNYPKNNEGDIIGYYEDDILLGYAVLIYYENIILLDYLAIIEEYRNRGYGQKFLQEIKKMYKDSDVIFIESEVPDNETAKRRISFYKRSGAVLTDIRIYLYYVYYMAMVIRIKDDYDLNNVHNDLHKIYSHFYSELIKRGLLKY